MKLDKLSGGGEWLLRLAGHNIVLDGNDLDKLAQILAFRLDSHGITDKCGVSLSVSPDGSAHVHIAFSDEIPVLIEQLQEMLPEYMKETK